MESRERASFATVSRLNLCIAGATGWTGSALVEAVAAADDLELRSAVSRSAAGGEIAGAPVYATVAEALDQVDVLVDYTSHDVVKANALAAIERGVAVVIGTSGLTADDFADIDSAARDRGVGVIAAGNFSLTAAMAQAAALLAARHLPAWEVIDYASAGKPDAPSGTARELAERLGASQKERPAAETAGAPEARGADIAGTQVHSLRLPSFTVSTEVVFALPDERLSIRHDAGSSAAPYVAGTLLAARAAPSTTGLVRGLDTLLLGYPPRDLTETTIRRSFPADRGAPGVARRAVREFLRGRGADPARLSDVLLAVSEVVTNCVVHGYRDGPAGDVALEARHTGDHLVLSVADQGTGMRPRLDSPGLGLGLPLVGRVADRVDIKAADGGGTLVRMSFSLD